MFDSEQPISDELLRITPKGALCVALGGNVALTESAWEAMRDVAYRTSCKGEFDIPAMAFDGGGKCFSVTRKQ